MKSDSTVRVAIAWLIATLVGAHILVPNEYGMVSNTLAHLGAQQAPNAWIARGGMIGFGVLLAWHYSGDLVLVRRFWVEAVLLLLFGSSVALTGVFSTAPYETGVAYSEAEATLHATFAVIAGLCMSGVMVSAAWRSSARRETWKHAGAFVVTALSTVLFVGWPPFQGVTDRVLWLTWLGWLGWSGGSSGHDVRAT